MSRGVCGEFPRFAGAFSWRSGNSGLPVTVCWPFWPPLPCASGEKRVFHPLAIPLHGLDLMLLLFMLLILVIFGTGHATRSSTAQGTMRSVAVQMQSPGHHGPGRQRRCPIPSRTLALSQLRLGTPNACKAIIIPGPILAMDPLLRSFVTFSFHFLFSLPLFHFHLHLSHIPL